MNYAEIQTAALEFGGKVAEGFTGLSKTVAAELGGVAAYGFDEGALWAFRYLSNELQLRLDTIKDESPEDLIDNVAGIKFAYNCLIDYLRVNGDPYK